MNKQAVIEILEQERNLLKAGDPDSTVWNAEGWAKHIYKRIAPLREFPEMAIWRVLSGIYLDGYTHGKGGEVWEVAAANKYIPAFKRLWEGTEGFDGIDDHIVIGDIPHMTITDRHLTEEKLWAVYREWRNTCDEQNKKGGCPTCGGSGSILDKSLPDRKFDVKTNPCSVCDGTGERRKDTDAK